MKVKDLIWILKGFNEEFEVILYDEQQGIGFTTEPNLTMTSLKKLKCKNDFYSEELKEETFIRLNSPIQ